MAEGNEVEKDMLYLACTRPAMKWGVPVEALMINLGVSYLAFMVYGHANLLSIRGITSVFVFPVVQGVMRALIELDHNIFRLIRLHVELSGVRIYGVSNLWAMSRHLPATARNTSSCV